MNFGIFIIIDVRSIDSNDEEKQRKQDLIIARKADRDTHKCTRTDWQTLLHRVGRYRKGKRHGQADKPKFSEFFFYVFLIINGFHVEEKFKK